MQPGLAEFVEEIRHRVLVAIVDGQWHGLLVQLQGALAVSGQGIDISTFATPITAIELAGDDKALAVTVKKRLRGRLQQPPVALVCGDNLVAEIVHFINPIELPQALNGVRQIVADLDWVVFRIECQLLVIFQSVLKVSLFLGLLSSLAHCARFDFRSHKPKPQ